MREREIDIHSTVDVCVCVYLDIMVSPHKQPSMPYTQFIVKNPETLEISILQLSF